MKSIIIARVSTEEQKEAGNSLPAQKVRLENYCQRKGFEIIKIFSFDESAYKTKRNDFDQILDFVLSQKEKIAVCFDKVDRLSRNVFDKRVSLLYEKALKDEIELHFVSDGQVINSQLSAAEKFHFSISLGLAKYYSDAISDSVKRAYEQKIRNGEWIGRPRYGYKCITFGNNKKGQVIDEFPSKVVLKMYQWYSTGAFSIRTVRIKLLKEYKIDFSNGYTDKILSDSFYYGMMKIKGHLYPHKYPPVITKELFDKVQAIKKGYHKKHFKFAGLPYFYRGLIRCADCGCMITPEKAKDKYVYYHCTQYKGKHGAEWLREEELTNQFGKLFKTLQVPDYVVSDIINTLKDLHQQKSDFREKYALKLSQEREKFSKMREELYMDKLSGSITASEYDKFETKLKDKLADIELNQSKLHQAENQYYITVSYLLTLANRAYELFKSSEIEERRQLLKLILQNCRLKGKKLEFDLIKPYDSVFYYASRHLWLRGQDSNL